MMWAPFFTCQRAISLASSHFSSAIIFLNRREPMTLVRSPTIKRAAGVFGLDQFDAGIIGAMRGRVYDVRRAALRHFDHGADVRRGGPAAAAYDIQPALLDEFRELAGQRFGRLQVLVVFVGQAGVGVTGDARRRHVRQGADVIRHQVGAGGAVESDGEQIGVGYGGVEGVDGLAGEHRSPALDGAGDHDGDALA